MTADRSRGERLRRVAKRLLVWVVRAENVVLHVLTAVVALMILIAILRFLLS